MSLFYNHNNRPVIYMFDRYYTTRNILVDKAEIPYCPRLKAWILPGGSIIKNQADAIKYACKLNDLINNQKK